MCLSDLCVVNYDGARRVVVAFAYDGRRRGRVDVVLLSEC